MTADDAAGPTREQRIAWGHLLRAAREALGASPDDVAGRLNLRTSFVVAVEEGRGDEHMDWSYERNHIRAIAALLDVDLGEVSA